VQPIDPYAYTTVQGLRVKAIPVKHRIHTTGFLVKEGGKTIVLTSDTGMTRQLWEMARLEENLSFIIAHVAFPNRLSGFAKKAPVI
jgi:ribonuclease BN (tRNA processing enzyme)